MGNEGMKDERQRMQVLTVRLPVEEPNRNGAEGMSEMQTDAVELAGMVAAQETKG